MNTLFCMRCNSNELDRYKRESIIYHCKKCGGYFRASEVKDFLLGEVRKETEKLGQQGACPRCGRKLNEPDWCSWCGDSPYSVEDAIKKLNEQIRAIEPIIASDAVEDRNIMAEKQAEDQRARAGDFQAQSHIFQRVKSVANIYEKNVTTEPDWKRLIDLGESVVPFLINHLEDDTKGKKVAISALIEIGDDRAVAPLVKALGPMKNDRLDNTILEALKTQWSAIIPGHVGQLLLKANEISTTIKSEDSYRRGVLSGILQLMETILVQSANGISEADLQAISGLKDISLKVSVGTGNWVHGDDGWGYLDFEETREVAQTIDCSSLREAAQREIKRRACIPLH